METIHLNRFDQHTKIRAACRGIVVKDGKILLTYEVNRDQWFIPGSGVEGNENLKQCCIRELAEETGCVVTLLFHYLTINEYYEEWLYISHYFICVITGQTGHRAPSDSGFSGDGSFCLFSPSVPGSFENLENFSI